MCVTQPPLTPAPGIWRTIEDIRPDRVHIYTYKSFFKKGQTSIKYNHPQDSRLLSVSSLIPTSNQLPHLKHAWG